MKCGADAVDEIRAEWEAVLRAWEELHLKWRDPVSERFQRQYMDEWHHQVQALVRAATAYVAQLDRAMNSNSG